MVTPAQLALEEAPSSTQMICAHGSDGKPTPDRSRLGRRSRRKGQTFERDVAALLRPVFPNAKRGFQSRSGRDGADVEGTPYFLECKHGKCVNVRAALKQALDATDGRPAVVIAKDDRSEPFIVMRLGDLLALAKQLQESTTSDNQIRQAHASMLQPQLEY